MHYCRCTCSATLIKLRVLVKECACGILEAVLTTTTDLDKTCLQFAGLQLLITVYTHTHTRYNEFWHCTVCVNCVVTAAVWGMQWDQRWTGNGWEWGGRSLFKVTQELLPQLPVALSRFEPCTSNTFQHSRYGNLLSVQIRNYRFKI
jgi:hypothetical protein